MLSEATLTTYRAPKAAKTKDDYTLDQFGYLTGEIGALFGAFQTRVLNLDSSVKQEIKKLYIAFKLDTNFVDVVPQKSRLILSLNMPFDEIRDPQKLCRDVRGLGRWGNGSAEVILAAPDKLDDVMQLVRQAYEWQVDN